METLLATGEKYTERSLREKLDFVTDTLLPGPGYNLTLEGLQAPVLTLKELSAYFGVELDDTAGALVSLGYNPNAHKLALEQVAFPIKGSDKVAQLVSVEAGGYIPAIEGFIPEMAKGSITTGEKQDAISYDKADALLRSFGITEAPLDSASTYRDWRDTVLEQSSGWHLIETLQISDAVTTDSIQYTTLRREDALSLQRERMVDIRQFTRTIVQYDTDNGSQHFTEQVLESSQGTDVKNLRLYLNSYSKTPDIIFGDMKANISEPQLTAIQLNRESYENYSSALEKVVADLYGKY